MKVLTTNRPVRGIPGHIMLARIGIQVGGDGDQDLAACICYFTNSHAGGYIQDMRPPNSRQRPFVCLP